MRYSTILWTVFSLSAAALLYGVKYKVQEMDVQIARLHTQIAESKSSLQVLNAEWAYLTRPERLRELSDRHLELASLSGQQMVELANLPYVNGGVQLAGLEYEPR